MYNYAINEMVWLTHLIAISAAYLTQQGTASVYGSITRQTACTSFIAFQIHKHSLGQFFFSNWQSLYSLEVHVWTNRSVTVKRNYAL